MGQGPRSVEQRLEWSAAAVAALTAGHADQCCMLLAPAARETKHGNQLCNYQHAELEWTRAMAVVVLVLVHSDLPTYRAPACSPGHGTHLVRV
jgi:hypothetical protein